MDCFYIFDTWKDIINMIFAENVFAKDVGIIKIVLTTFPPTWTELYVLFLQIFGSVFYKQTSENRERHPVFIFSTYEYVLTLCLL